MRTRKFSFANTVQISNSQEGRLCLSFDADLLDKRIIGNAKKVVGRDIESCQGWLILGRKAPDPLELACSARSTPSSLPFQQPQPPSLRTSSSLLAYTRQPTPSSTLWAALTTKQTFSFRLFSGRVIRYYIVGTRGYLEFRVTSKGRPRCFNR